MHYLNVCHLTDSLHGLEVSSDILLDLGLVGNTFEITPEMEYDSILFTSHHFYMLQEMEPTKGIEPPT